MNLFFRRFWLYLSTAFGTKQAPLLGKHTRKFRVWLTDQDMFLHMTNSRYLSFSDLARLNLIIRTGLNRHLQNKGWHLEICAQTRTITRMLKAPQTFVATCEIMGWTDQYIAFQHHLIRGEKTHAEINTIMRISAAEAAPVATSALLEAIRWTGVSPSLSKIYLDLIEQSEEAQTDNTQIHQPK